jgi:hypothetical protein
MFSALLSENEQKIKQKIFLLSIKKIEQYQSAKKEKPEFTEAALLLVFSVVTASAVLKFFTNKNFLSLR